MEEDSIIVGNEREIGKSTAVPCNYLKFLYIFKLVFINNIFFIILL
jgi:hypothetical protein